MIARREFLAGIASLTLVKQANAFSHGTAPRGLRAKLIQLFNAAALSNPTINPPLVAPIAWAQSTPYVVGNMRTANGQLYICRTAGTSAASGAGPTGTTAIQQTDGTAVWEYIGAIPVASGTPPAMAPATGIASSSTPPGLTSLNRYIDDPTKYKFGGGRPVAVFADWRAAAASTVVSNGSQGTDYFASMRLEFVVDAVKFAVGGAAGGQFRVIIDGQYYQNSPLYWSAAGSPCWLTFDFTNAGGKKARTIVIEQGASLFYGVRVAPGDTVSAPSSANDIRAICFGDSINIGGNAYPTVQGDGVPIRLGRLLGWNDVWNSSLGGTGYIAQGPYGVNYGNHIADATANSTNLVLVFGGAFNDSANSSPTIRAAVLLFLQNLRAALPTVPIMVFGTWPASTGPSASNLALEQDVKASVTTFNDLLCKFIPLNSDPTGSWVTGTGNVSAPTGVGNADLYVSNDLVHEPNVGMEYLAGRYATPIKSTITTWTALDAL